MLAYVPFVPDSVVLRELCVCPQVCQRGFISHSFKTVVLLCYCCMGVAVMMNELLVLLYMLKIEVLCLSLLTVLVNCCSVSLWCPTWMIWSSPFCELHKVKVKLTTLTALHLPSRLPHKSGAEVALPLLFIPPSPERRYPHSQLCYSVGFSCLCIYGTAFCFLG